MAVATKARVDPMRARTPLRLPHEARRVLPEVLAVGAGVGFVVARDGSTGWQIARLVAVVTVTAVTWLAGRHRGRASRAGLVFVVGVCAVAIGVGIAAPHLAKTGLGSMAFAGLLCLGGGLVLTARGAIALVLLVQRWMRVPVALAQATLVVVALFALGQATAATNVPRTEVGTTTPGDLGVPYRDVEFRTDDDVTLSGWYIASRNGAAVVLLHGAGSTRSDVLDHAVVLARRGYGVILFDARGHGRSGGRAMDFGWYGDLDVAAATGFLAAQPDVDPTRIGAVGMSMGGEEAIGAAAADARIRAVVAEGATGRVAGDRAWLSEAFGWRGAIQERVEWLLLQTTDVLTAAEPPMTLRNAVAAIAPRRVLLIAAGFEADEGHAGRFIRAGAPDSVELWVVAGTGHTDALTTHPDEWERRVTAFLDAALVSTAAP